MISDVVAIDPGVRALGWVRGERERITAAGLSKLPGSRTFSFPECAAMHAAAIGRGSARLAIVESMVYAADRATTPQDLIDVQTVGCLTAAQVAPGVVLRRPDEWKYAVPKDIHHERIRAVLRPEERAIVDAAALAAGKTHAKEVLDAVGILLQYWKRTNKSGEAYRHG